MERRESHKGKIPWNKGDGFYSNDTLDLFSKVQRKYSDNTINEAKKMRDNGDSYGKISKILNIHIQTIYYWFKKSRMINKKQ